MTYLVTSKAAFRLDLIVLLKVSQRTQEHADRVATTDCILSLPNVRRERIPCCWRRNAASFVRVCDGHHTLVVQCPDRLVDRRGRVR